MMPAKDLKLGLLYSGVNFGIHTVLIVLAGFLIQRRFNVSLLSAGADVMLCPRYCVTLVLMAFVALKLIDGFILRHTHVLWYIMMA